MKINCRFRLGLLGLLLCIVGTPALGADDAQTQKQSSDCDGSDPVALAYLDVGPKDKPPIVLIHGGTSYSHGWDLVINYLKNDFRLIAPDLRGHGRSPVPPCGYAAKDFSADVRLLMHQLGIAEAVVVGHSIGGMAALDMAVKEPRLVHKLVLIDTPVRPKDLDTVQDLNKYIQSASYPLPESFIISWTTYVEPVPPNFLAALRENTRDVPEIVWKKMIGAVAHADISALLPQVSQETAIIWGEKDTLLGMSQLNELSAGIECSRVRIIARADHSPNYEEPAIVAAVIRAQAQRDFEQSKPSQ